MKIVARENQLEISAPAKVNLFLELLGRRADGFHEIETVMSSVSLWDHLRFSSRDDSSIALTISHGTQGSQPRELDEIPADERNLVYKSLDLVRSIATQQGQGKQCSTGIDVHLQKNIPSAAGLGGASSNSAAALVAANRIWNLNWSTERLIDVAAQLGSDIAFFLTGGTAVCRGRGERVTPLTVAAGRPIVIVKPSDSLSTGKVFSKVKLGGEPRESESFIRNLQTGSLGSFGEHMFNRLQDFAKPLTSQISTIQGEFEKLNCVGHQMSGSGSSYFGLFNSFRAARCAASSLFSRLPTARIFCAHTLQ